MGRDKLVEDIGKIELSKFWWLLVDQTSTPSRDADILHTGDFVDMLERIAMELSIREHSSTSMITALQQPSPGTPPPSASHTVAQPLQKAYRCWVSAINNLQGPSYGNHSADLQDILSSFQVKHTNWAQAILNLGGSS
ncbi:hypothetical protein BU17DRAFT_87019 [Hysterangium stoloniferum]|nr:hypothetical protein BU17DRAFT_87019 [Hysterangium stoloniferum]